MPSTRRRPRDTAGVRLLVSVVVGAVVAVLTVVFRDGKYAPAAGWFVAATLFAVWTYLVVRHMGPEETRLHATEEDPTLRVTHGVMFVASVASVGGVAYLLTASSGQGTADTLAATFGVLSVAASWLLVHTLYCLRYARLYYSTSPPGGIDFNQEDEEPTYADFAYLSFTLGMTYQVSDTDLKTRPIRSTALHQALLSYLFGAIVLAVVINLVAGLGSSGGGH